MLAIIVMVVTLIIAMMKMLVTFRKNHNYKDNNGSSDNYNNNIDNLWQTGRFSPEVMLRVRFPETIWSKSAQAYQINL